MSKWEETRLGELIEINPETLSVSKYTGEIKYIDIASVNTGSLEGYTTYEISDAPSRARRIIKDKDIIFSTVRPNLKAYYFVKNAPPNAICSTGFAVLRAKKGVNSRFVYSLVTENSFVDYLTLVAKGSAYPAVDTNDFKKAKVTVPDLPTQERIADILSAYDDLIEANNSRIELLEQAAQELYKEWFVRFRFPGYESIKFENGVPEDWNVSKLSQISDFVYGKMPQQEHVLENGFPIFSGYRVSGYYDSFMFEEPMLVLIARGVGGTGEVKISPPCAHITNLAIVFKLNNPDLHKRYLYHMFTLQNLRYLDTGAAQSQITIENLKNVKVILPTDGLLEKFNKIIAPFYEEQDRLKSINENLIYQRDLLLPRLISGKLEV